MTIAQPIAEFFKRPRVTERGVLLGKGPSLDAYDTISGHGAFVMGLNEVPLAVPCDGVVFGDEECSKLQYAEHLDLFRQTRWEHSHNGRGYVFSKQKDGQPLAPSDMPIVGSATACRALTIMAVWGITHVQLWGFDAARPAKEYAGLYHGKKRTDVFSLRLRHVLLYETPNRVQKDYMRISKCIREVVAHFGLVAEFCYG